MNPIERRNTANPVALVRAEGADPKPSKIAGHAAVFFNAADAGTEYILMEYDGRKIIERIMPGAFDGVLADDVRCLYDHETDKLLGRTRSGTARIASDATGLGYECDLPETTLAADLRALIARGDITGSSFAFTVAGDGYHWLTEEARDIRVITRIERLYDVGPVTYPAYEASTTGLRASGDLAELRASLEAHRKATASQEAQQQAANEARARRARLVELGL
jgi:uncharacterized protein